MVKGTEKGYKGYICAILTIIMAEFMFGIEQLLPFFFVLAVVYGALEVSKIFKSSGVKGIISVVIALFAVVSPGVAEFIYQVLPYAVIFFVVFFFIGFVRSFFKGKEGEKRDYILPIIIGGLIIIFLSSQGDALKNLFPSAGFLSNDNFIVAVILVVILMILYAAYKAAKE